MKPPAEAVEEEEVETVGTISFDDSGGTPTYYFNVGDDQNTNSIYLKKSEGPHEIYSFIIDSTAQGDNKFELYTSHTAFNEQTSVAKDTKLNDGVVRATDKLTIDTAEIYYKNGENSQDLFLIGPEKSRSSWSNAALPQNYGILKIQINATGQRPDDGDGEGEGGETGGEGGGEPGGAQGA